MRANAEKIEMFEIDSSVDLLNRTLAQRGLTAADVIAIHEQPAAAMRMGEHLKAKLRVYVRMPNQGG